MSGFFQGVGEFRMGDTGFDHRIAGIAEDDEMLGRIPFNQYEAVFRAQGQDLDDGIVLDRHPSQTVHQQSREGVSGKLSGNGESRHSLHVGQRREHVVEERAVERRVVTRRLTDPAAAGRNLR